MNAVNVFRASVIAFIVALVVPIAVALSTGESVHFKTPMIVQEFYSLSYEEQQTWRKENEIRIRGLGYLKEVISEPFLFWQLLWGAVISFVVVFCSCMAMVWWEKKA